VTCIQILEIDVTPAKRKQFTDPKRPTHSYPLHHMHTLVANPFPEAYNSPDIKALNRYLGLS